MIESEKLADEIITVLLEHKAENIVKIDTRNLENCFCKFLIVCQGNSTTHVSSLLRDVNDDLIEAIGEKPFHVEGREFSQWVILDYCDVVVHIFIDELRRYYQIEDFWADGITTKYANV